MITGKYPNLRLRRSRKYAWSRKLVQESSLSYSDLILPIFLIEGKNKKESIKSMPNVFRYSVDKLNIVVGKAIKKGIPIHKVQVLNRCPLIPGIIQPIRIGNPNPKSKPKSLNFFFKNGSLINQSNSNSCFQFSFVSVLG